MNPPNPAFLPTDIALPYGLGPDGVLVSVAKVAAGLACGCSCPGCGKPLIAKKGLVIRHHFAHASDQACQTGFESMLHLLAKDIVARERSITVPPVVVVVGLSRRPIKDAAIYPLENVRLERWLDGIRPDIVADVGSHQLIIEIAVTHKAEPEKIAKLAERGAPAIEIDLSEFHRREVNVHALRDAILHAAPRVWLFNRLAASALSEVRAEEDARIEKERLREEAAAEERAFLALEWARWVEQEEERTEASRQRRHTEEQALLSEIEKAKGRILPDASDVFGDAGALVWVERSASHYTSLCGGIRGVDVADLEVWCRERLRRERVSLRGVEIANQSTRDNVLRAALAKFKDRAKADLWMNTNNPKIGGRPADVCLQPNGLDRCKGALR